MFWGRVRAYMVHEDPATAIANLVAMVVGWNAPLYPIYVVAMAGWSVAAPALLTAAAAPFFLAIPAVSRISSRAGRLALPLVGTANTLWCIKLLSTTCALELFLMPCVILSALLYRRGERPWMILAASLAFAANFVPASFIGTPLISLSAEAARHLAALNEGSVITLVLLVSWQLAALLRGNG